MSCKASNALPESSDVDAWSTISKWTFLVTPLTVQWSFFAASWVYHRLITKLEFGVRLVGYCAGDSFVVSER